MLLGLGFVIGGLFIAFFKKVFIDIVAWVNKWELQITMSLPAVHNIVSGKAKWYAKVLPGASIWIGAFLVVVGLYLIFK